MRMRAAEIPQIWNLFMQALCPDAMEILLICQALGLPGGFSGW